MRKEKTGLNPTTHRRRGAVVAEEEPPLEGLGELGDGADPVLRDGRLGVAAVHRVGSANSLVVPRVRPVLPGLRVTRARSHRRRVEVVQPHGVQLRLWTQTGTGHVVGPRSLLRGTVTVPFKRPRGGKVKT